MKYLFLVLVVVTALGTSSCRRVLGNRSWTGGTFTAIIDGTRWKASIGTVNFPFEDQIYVEATGKHGTALINIPTTETGVYSGLGISMVFGIEEWSGASSDQVYSNSYNLNTSDITVEVIKNDEDELKIEFEGKLYDNAGNTVDVTKGVVQHKKMAEE